VLKKHNPFIKILSEDFIGYPDALVSSNMGSDFHDNGAPDYRFSKRFS